MLGRRRPNFLGTMEVLVPHERCAAPGVLGFGLRGWGFGVGGSGLGFGITFWLIWFFLQRVLGREYWVEDLRLRVDGLICTDWGFGVLVSGCQVSGLNPRLQSRAFFFCIPAGCGLRVSGSGFGV